MSDKCSIRVCGDFITNLVRTLTNLLVIVLLLNLCQLVARAEGGDRDQLIYFDPDSAQGNLARLKDEFNSFLQGAGLNISAQPVTRIDAFESLAENSAFLVVPRWYLEIPQASTLTPLLVLADQGRQSFRKIIVVRQDSGLKASDLKDRKVAMAMVNRDAARELVSRTLLAQYNLDQNSPQFILTPRDYDSIIALLLGKVEGAVISARSLVRMGRMNPALVKRMKTVGESSPIPTPVLCLRGKHHDRDKLLKLFLAMNGGMKQEVFMQILGFDGWQEYSVAQNGEVLQ